MKAIILILIIPTLLILLLSSLAASDQISQSLSDDDKAFLKNIVSILELFPGKFEDSSDGPYLKNDAGLKRANIIRFIGDYSVFERLGNILDKDNSVAHQVISTLVECLDIMNPSKTTYNGKPLPLGLMCYEALHSICYYEATDENGNITAWDGAVLPNATEEDLKAAKKAWEKILKERAYILL